MPATAQKTSPSDAAAKCRDQVSGWSEDDLIDPHHHAEKAGKVRGMFAAIAGRYDLNNRVHSLWRDQAWRRYAVGAAAVRPGETVVDVACGTGDLTEMFARRTRAARVIGIDFTPEMLDVARAKLARRRACRAGRGGDAAGEATILYQEGDAQALDLPDESVDVVSIAFGIRNVTDPAKAVGEFDRVLRPGGRLVILEFDRPRLGLLRWFNDFYCGWVMPRTATLISGDRTGAYRYLPRSVGSFMSRGALVALMEARGFAEVSAHPLTLGICTCYRGVKR